MRDAPVKDVGPAPRRRSVHFVPGGNERFLTRALTSAADSLVLDLEDSVPADDRAKTRAREAVVEWLAGIETDKELMVRINAVDTRWWADDVDAVGPLVPWSLMVPKASSAADLDDIESRLLAAQPGSHTSLFPVATETAEAVGAVAEMAAHRRVDGLCWGAEDLSTALGARTARDGDGQFLPVFRTVQSLCLIGAATGGIGAVDAVWTDLGDLDGLRRECELSAAMGYVGKITVHPDQIDVVNAAFTPSPELVAESSELLVAFADHERSGSGAFRFRGQMVDAPHLERARRTLAQADRPDRGDTGPHGGAGTGTA
jgi:citrate lyase subunit beta/citryl-CoA lyase